MNYIWVKKSISKADWRNHHSHLATYCFLKKEGDRVWIGFLIPGDKLPYDCFAVSDYELYQIDEYRRVKNVYPLPLEKAKTEDKKEVSEKAINKLDEMKNKFLGKTAYKSINEPISGEIDPKRIPF